MPTDTVKSSDPKAVSSALQEQLGGLIDQARGEIDNIREPRFQALLETTAEVLIGLRTAYRDYNAGTEKVWKK